MNLVLIEIYPYFQKMFDTKAQYESTLFQKNFYGKSNGQFNYSVIDEIEIACKYKK